MSVSDVSAAWKTALESRNKPRIYFDPRQQEYPSIAGSPTFTAVDAWRYGSHDLTGGYAEFLLTMPNTFSFEMLAYPNFAYDTADDPCIFSWYWTANIYFKLYYNHTDDKFRCEYKDGGTARYLESQQFDDGSSHDNISAWLTFGGALS